MTDLEKVAREMFDALSGLSVIAEMNVEDLIGEDLLPADIRRMELQRWGAVGNAINSYCRLMSKNAGG